MLKRTLLFISFLFVGSVGYAEKSIPPAPKNYVYDEPGLLTQRITELSQFLSNEDQKSGNQILVAVFKSLEQEDPVDYTNRLFQAWNPGEKGKNNGALIAFYLQEKKIRIEVGYGLEPLLTDAKSKLIIVDILQPAFRAQRFGEGVLDAVTEIQKIIHSDGTESSEHQAKAQPPENFVRGVFFILFIFIVIGFYLIDKIGMHLGWGESQTFGSTPRYRSRDSGWGGGGWSSGGGSGGGFSGGGGSSGGGGASGDW